MIEILIKVYFCIPLILVVVTIGLIISGKNKINRYNECVGVITRLYKRRKRSMGSSYVKIYTIPVVSYTINGENREFDGDFYWPDMKVGSQVILLYDKNDNSKITIKSSLYFAPAITGGLAVCFTFPIIIFFILKSYGIISF